MSYVPRLKTYRRQGFHRILWRRSLVVGLWFVIFMLLLRGLLANTWMVGSNAMSPTLRYRDRVISTPFLFGKENPFTGGTALDFRGPSRGGLVLVVPPWAEGDPLPLRWLEGLVYPLLGPDREVNSAWRASQPVIRRVVGLPGDTVRFRQGRLEIQVAGTEGFVPLETLLEREGIKGFPALPDLAALAPGGFGLDAPDTLVLEGEYYLLADQWDRAQDSRHWGSVSRRRLRGQVVFRYWPLGGLGFL